MLRHDDARRLGEDAVAIYRKKHGLLSADEIWERFDLTQAAMDILLRLIRDLPGSVDYLRGHA